MLLSPPVHYWRCASCLGVSRSEGIGVQTQMHSCPAMMDMTIPMVEVDHPDDMPDSRNRVEWREDVLHTAGAIITDHGDGRRDVSVLAPTATTAIEGALQ